jgi:serine/threonine-protein kinase
MKKMIVDGQGVSDDWPPAHPSGRQDTESGWARPTPTSPDDGNSSQPLTEHGEEYSCPVSESPPPTIEAFPDDDSKQELLPQKNIDSPSVPWRTIVSLVAASIAVILVVVAATIAFRRPGGPNPSPAPAPSTTATVPLTPSPPVVISTQALPSTVTVTAPTVTVTTTPSPTLPVPPAPQNCEPASLQQLRAQANIDSPVVTAWAENRWVPQLSSKRPGTIDDGKVWDCRAIWLEHLQLRQRYDAKLLWSGDWQGTFKKHDYWVTVAGMSYPTSGDAQAWCDSHGRDSDHCFPTLIQ